MPAIHFPSPRRKKDAGTADYCRLPRHIHWVVIFAEMFTRNSNTDPLRQEQVEVLTDESTGYSLIVWNDDVNTFEWVITTLIEICHHTQEQAEQCALLIHTQGKYAVKQGSFEMLKPMCEAICDRGINATVEESN